MIDDGRPIPSLDRRGVAVDMAHDGAENVCNAYGSSIDEFAGDDMSDIFAVNGWKERPDVGADIGRERIRASVKTRCGPFPDIATLGIHDKNPVSGRAPALLLP